MRWGWLLVLACGEAPTGSLLCPPGTTSAQNGCTSPKPSRMDGGAVASDAGAVILPARVSPTELNFGVTSAGQSVSRFFNIENPNRSGSVTVSMGTPSNRAFRFGPDTPLGDVELSPREEISIHVIFDPDRLERYSGTIDVECGPSCQVTVTLTGASEITPLACSSLDFGTVDAGTCATGVVTCFNPNDTPLIVTAFLIGDPAFEIGVLPNPDLPPGASPAVEILFCPRVEGEFFTQLEVDLLTEGLTISSFAPISGRTFRPPPPPPPPPPPAGTVTCGAIAALGPTQVGHTDYWLFPCNATNGAALVEDGSLSPAVAGATIRLFDVNGGTAIPPPQTLSTVWIEIGFTPREPGTFDTTIEIKTGGGTAVANLRLIAE